MQKSKENTPGGSHQTLERHLLPVSELLRVTADLLPRPRRQAVFGDPRPGAPPVFFDSFPTRSVEKERCKVISKDDGACEE